MLKFDPNAPAFVPSFGRTRSKTPPQTEQPPVRQEQQRGSELNVEVSGPTDNNLAFSVSGRRPAAKKELSTDWGLTDRMLIFANLTASTTVNDIKAQMDYVKKVNPVMVVMDNVGDTDCRVIVAEFLTKEDAIEIGMSLNGNSVQGNVLVVFILADFVDLVKRARRTVLVASMDNRMDNEFMHRFFRKNGTLDFWATAPAGMVLRILDAYVSDPSMMFKRSCQNPLIGGFLMVPI